MLELTALWGYSSIYVTLDRLVGAVAPGEHLNPAAADTPEQLGCVRVGRATPGAVGRVREGTQACNLVSQGGEEAGGVGRQRGGVVYMVLSVVYNSGAEGEKGGRTLSGPFLP